MMKRILQIALCALVAGLLARMANAYLSVPQTSAADYIFTIPVQTNHIRGFVIDPTNHYGVIRSEDVSWIWEAWYERSAILGGSTNGIPHQTGVKAKVELDNAEIPVLDRGSYASGWLDADAPLLSSVRLFNGVPVTTNVCIDTWTNYLSIYSTTTSVSVITMPMANGATSVFTNRWTARKVTDPNAPTTNTYTWSYIDLCHGVADAPFPGCTNAPSYAWNYPRGFLETYGAMPTAASFAHAYAILKETKRLADNLLFWTNTPPFTITTETYDSGSSTYGPYVSTNYLGGFEFSAQVSHDGAEITRPVAPASATVQSRFSPALNSLGGSTRISIEAAYAVCSFYYYHYNGSSTVSSTNCYAIVPIAATLDADTSGRYLCAKTSSLDTYSLCSQCASAAGATSPPLVATARESEHTTKFWNLSLYCIVLFYRITPAARLPDW